jgi:hypothetical protein
MGKAIARPDDKTIKSIIGMESEAGPGTARGTVEFVAGVNAEIYRNEMAGNLLGGTGKTRFAVVLQKLNGRLIGTAYSERTTIQMQNSQLLEPLACAGRVKCFCTLKYIGKYVFNVAGSHTTILCEAMSYAEGNSPPEHPCQRISTFSRTHQAQADAQQVQDDSGNLTGIAQLVKSKLHLSTRGKRRRLLG